jgi:hypothetical protein
LPLAAAVSPRSFAEIEDLCSGVPLRMGRATFEEASELLGVGAQVLNVDSEEQVKPELVKQYDQLVKTSAETTLNPMQAVQATPAGKNLQAVASGKDEDDDEMTALQPTGAEQWGAEEDMGGIELHVFHKWVAERLGYGPSSGGQ